MFHRSYYHTYFLSASLIFPMLFFAGCGSSTSLPLTQTSSATITAAITSTYTLPVPTHTASVMPLTATLKPTSTLTLAPSTSTPVIPPEARLQIRQIQLTKSNEYHGEGYAVIREVSEKIVIVMDLASGGKWQFQQQGNTRDEFGILSPDEKWLVRQKNVGVKEPGDQVYEVISAEGKVQNVFSLPWEWVLRDNWINNQQILADKQVNPGIQIYQTMAISPVTGQKRLLPNDFPNPYQGFMMHEYDYNVYSPSLDYVVYPEHAMLTLRNVKTRENITSFIILDREPAWSPDGKMFAIGTNSSIYGIGLDGSQKRLTYVDHYNGPGISMGGDKLRWSPDGKKIAFSMSPSLHPNGLEDIFCLAILDVTSEAVTDYCIPDYNIKSQMFSYPVVWASDSQRLLVEGINFSPVTGGSHALLIDLGKDVAVDMGKGGNMEPLYFISFLPSVWMKK